MAVIEVANVSKMYRPRRHASKLLLGREGLFRLLTRSRPEPFHALRDVSFTVEEGESLGLIGANGSGKSTLMKILAGVTAPTTGDVTVRGRVASLLELGAGFHPFLTGRENVYLNAGLLGMRHAQTDQVFDDIVAFSGIGDFIDHPVDTYSSGMYVRIAFSVAVHVNPDVFLVDEVLAVGDEEFQRKCRTRIGELKEQGKTIVFVSHDLGIVNTLCHRVVLLNKGKMLVRDTPQKTIDFYLRQVGQEQGMHTFAAGELDGILSNGRISLFHRQEEITAPLGLNGRIQSLGMWHESTGAAWFIEEESPTGCLARGAFGRLPATFWWRVEADQCGVRWNIDIEFERDTPIDEIAFNLFFPAAFTQWLYGDLSGEFPEITPGDVTWTIIASPERTAHEAVALPAPESPLPAVDVRMEHMGPNFRLSWANSDYVAGSRVLLASCRYSSTEQTHTAGRHQLLSLYFDLSRSAEEARSHVQLERTLEAGPLTARFEQGSIHLAVDGEELTSRLHLYSSMLIHHLWHDSTSLQWGPIDHDGQRLRITGESRRFPLLHHWELAVDGDPIVFRITLEAKDQLEIQEYQTSILLRPEYHHWESDHESGAFPPIPAGDTTWRHLNQDYRPGSRLTAWADALPTVTLEIMDESPPARMTPLNTGSFESCRVLQALCVAQSGLLYYPLGTYTYFAGRIRIARSHKG